jgi:hypothetical protein
LDAQGNVYITGNFIGTVDFDPGPGVATLTSGMPFDAFICKLDARGRYLWAKGISASTYTPATGIAIDRSGDVYITGDFTGSVDADPGSGTYYLNTVNGNPQDVYVLKLNSNGSFVWAKAIGGNGYDHASAIAVDSKGSVYTIGAFIDTVDFDPSPSGVANLVASGPGNSIFISKLDSAGNYVWANTFSGAVSGYALALDDSSNVYATGTFGGIADFDPGPSTALLNASTNGSLFVCKLSPNGAYQWAKAAGGQNGLGNQIALDGAGNIFVTGGFQGTADFDPGPGTAYLTAPGQPSLDIFVLKLSAAGNYSWAKAFGGKGDDRSSNIAVDPQGNVFTTGYFNDSLDFDPGSGVAMLRSAGGDDAFISKLDNNGNYVWARSIGGVNDDGGFGLAANGAGDVYCVGKFRGTADLNPGTGQSLVSSTNLSGFVLRWSDCTSMGLAAVNCSATLTTLPINGNTQPLQFTASCADIAALRPMGISPVQGAVTASVYIDSIAPTDSVRVYVRRHYDVAPAAAAATATGRLTLYYTQADFDHYNSNAAPHLPTGPGDTAGIAHLRIRQEHGTSATGMPGSYTGWAGATPSVRGINPADNDILWNSSAARWEVSFDVAGFSGFFAYGAIDTALSTPRIPVRNAVTVKPVPATNEIFIHCTDPGLYEKQARIYDMRGAAIASFPIESTTALDVRSWVPGIYMLRLPNRITIRLLKQ